MWTYQIKIYFQCCDIYSNIYIKLKIYLKKLYLLQIIFTNYIYIAKIFI